MIASPFAQTCRTMISRSAAISAAAAGSSLSMTQGRNLSTIAAPQLKSTYSATCLPNWISTTCTKRINGHTIQIPNRTLSTQANSKSTTTKLPQLLHTIEEVRAVQAKIIREGGSFGFVPTMGALHEGHVALAARSMKENTATVSLSHKYRLVTLDVRAQSDAFGFWLCCFVQLVSIFVNPTQFLAHEDLGSYPRTLDSDLKQLAAIGVPYVFAPTVQEMYPSWPEFLTTVEMAGSDLTAEGKQRPGHFKGVATVVSKLFNIVRPTRAYFGQKDGMQCVVIRRMVRDLDFPVDIRICPTIRAKDGLALSSRNVYLTPGERAVAPVLFRALTASNRLYLAGERDATRLKQAAREVLLSEPMGRLEYVSLAEADSGKEILDGETITTAVLDPSTGQVVRGGAMVSIAYKLGKPRLIDNCILGQVLKPE